MLAIYLSPLADYKLRKLLSFLEEEWSVKSRNKFLEKLQDEFNKISQHPESCPQSELQPELFRCVVTKQTSFYYRIQNRDIEIITVFDNRQNTSELKKEIEKFFR